MKIKFGQPELDWLHNMVNRLIHITSRIDPMAARIASKMRYKFYGNPTLVNLNEKERNLIRNIVVYRAESLKASPSEERDIVNRIIQVLD